MILDIGSKNPRVKPWTSLGTAVVMALIDEPDAPKLMLDAIANRWMSAIHGVSPLTRSVSA